jgi:hypothetical protein
MSSPWSSWTAAWTTPQTEQGEADGQQTPEQTREQVERKVRARISEARAEAGLQNPLWDSLVSLSQPTKLAERVGVWWSGSDAKLPGRRTRVGTLLPSETETKNDDNGKDEDLGLSSPARLELDCLGITDDLEPEVWLPPDLCEQLPRLETLTCGSILPYASLPPR